MAKNYNKPDQRSYKLNVDLDLRIEKLLIKAKENGNVNLRKYEFFNQLIEEIIILKEKENK